MVYLESSEGVSILAHPEGRALLRMACITLRKYPFQSSPTPKGGRYWGCEAGAM